MIRMNPAHDTVNPPGCVQPTQQENVKHQEKPLEKEIDAYQRGFEDGKLFEKRRLGLVPNWNSEFDR